MKRYTKSVLLTACLGLCLLLTACGGAPGPALSLFQRFRSEPEPEPEVLPEVRFNEVMSSNKSTLALRDGSFPDWLELHNAGEEPADLSGFELRCGDDSWTLPPLVLEPGEYRLIYCDGTDSAGEELHSGFSISRDGESLRLLSPAGTELDKLVLPYLDSDVSFAREADGVFRETRWVSPGYENGEDGYESFQRGRTAPAGELAIGEAMVYNAWYRPQYDEYYDWVEISNFSGQTLELSDYYLSDKGKNRLLFRLPAGELAPGESTVIFCTDELEGGTAAPFGLSSGGETLYLSRGDGTLCDYVCLRDIPLGCSMGRQNGEGGFFYFASPSPGAANSGGVRFTGEKPRALSPDGVFDGVDSVTVELAGAGTICYTLDGSVPTESSEIYTGPFRLTETGVVRAVSFQADRLPSETLSLSYIINEGHVLPVVSLVCDPDDLFGSSRGIYANPAETWEREGCVMFYEDGAGFRIDCGVKLHGATSRIAQEKKSFKLLFRDRYEGQLHYDLFENGVLDFSSILLRAAQEADQSTLMRDNLMHQLSMQAFPELPAQDYHYAVLYLNGEYWGVYNIREAHSATHYAQHYGYDVNTVSQWQSEWPRDSLAAEVYDFAMNNDLKKDDNYAYVARHVNADSVIAWCTMQVYSGNFDFNSPNMRFYYSTEDEQLRFALVDLDLGMFDYGSFAQLFTFGYAYNNLARCMMRNEGFQREFVRQLAEALSGPLSEENAIAVIDRLEEELEPEMERDHELWGGTLYSWEHMVDHLREFVEMGRGLTKGVEEQLRISGFVSSEVIDDYFPR